MSLNGTPDDQDLQPDVDVVDFDPLDAIENQNYDDPTPEEITDPNHPDYVEPAEGVAPAVSAEASEEDQ